MTYLLTIFLILGIFYFALQIYRFFNKPEKVDYWDGPKPSEEEQKKTSHWMTDHLTTFPDSTILAREYPKEAHKAKAILLYNELEASKATGKIDEIEYHLQLEKILLLIDITDLKD